MKHYDKTRVTFHGGYGFNEEGIDKKPFATFTATTLISAEAVDKIIAVMREYCGTNGECCNVKLSAEDWDY
jgi:hypothetical protein